jgi:hypothetical protein
VISLSPSTCRKEGRLENNLLGPLTTLAVHALLARATEACSLHTHGAEKFERAPQG